MHRLLILALIALLVACTTTPAQPTTAPTITTLPSRTPQPTLTPVNFNPQTFPTAFIPPTSQLPPPAVIVPTLLPPNYTPEPRLLNGGRGLTNGGIMNNGEFQVEGYCQILNPNYGVDEDGTRWYCTNNGNRVVALGTAEFDDICVRTYNDPAAFGLQIIGNQPAAYRWRCFGY